MIEIQNLYLSKLKVGLLKIEKTRLVMTSFKIADTYFGGFTILIIKIMRIVRLVKATGNFLLFKEKKLSILCPKHVTGMNKKAKTMGEQSERLYTMPPPIRLSL